MNDGRRLAGPQREHRCWLGASLAVALILGCGGTDNVGTVTGKVLLDGQPVPNATVRFQPKHEGAPSLAVTNDQGEYELNYAGDVQGAEVGEHTVQITTFKAASPDSEPPRPMVPEKLPRKYNAKSELTKKVEAGANVIDFELNSK